MANYPFHDVQINGFRGLRSVELRDLGLINLLVGRNNSGKTSILEAMSIICNPFNPYEWLSMTARRDFGGLDETRIQSLRWCFEQHGELADPEAMYESVCEFKTKGMFPLRRLTAHYRDLTGEPSPEEIKLATRFGTSVRERVKRAFEEGWRGAELVHYVDSDVSSNPPSLFDTGTQSTIEPIAIRFWEDLPIENRRRRINLVSKRPRVESTILTPYSYQINRLQVRYQSEQTARDERRGSVLDLIRQFDPEIVDVDILSLRGGRPAIYIKHRRLGPAPLSIFGDALRRAVLLASTIPRLGEGGLLLIDEAETGIHVEALKSVFAWLIAMARQYGIQVIATTHSLEAVDAIVSSTESSADDLVTYHLEQTERETKVKRISGELLHRLRFERGLDVR